MEQPAGPPLKRPSKKASNLANLKGEGAPDLSNEERAELIKAKNAAFGGLRDRIAASGKSRRSIPISKPSAAAAAAQDNIVATMEKSAPRTL